jgi:hypothetical protein
MAAETLLRFADLEIDLLKRSVTRNGRAIELQPREFKLLECCDRSPARTSPIVASLRDASKPPPDVLNFRPRCSRRRDNAITRPERISR